MRAQFLGLTVGLVSIAAMWGAFQAGAWLGVLLAASLWASANYLVGLATGRAHYAHPGGGETGTPSPVSQDVV